MFFTYVLQSEKSGRFYIGHTEDLTARLDRHNNGFVISTRNKGPWKIAYSEKFQTKAEANIREMEIKSKKAENILKH
ncbi:GIY-YIG nuclease family protein [Pedobacter sp. SL55]|uniref:GIY-YIG nuclease family protein n=1 Tax=Pedobacter sp. SL55 TaxID=2995161 RepID=UPI0022715430|nr:GIY-YIG nuclease family protein [Pedobacter sp. SL55]WAC39465.1 GIY-YIG nuclease family protein [Pedobacter sp. SL55]WAC39466.1 GIY-YIG nuclease family protein [Pedobacter sp. SL55]